MSKLVRKQLYITQEQENRLKKKSEIMGVTQAELVREALDSHTYTVEYPTKKIDKWQEEVKFINNRMRQKELIREERTWTREELYDR